MDCTITRMNFMYPLRHPLPISDQFYPEQSLVRISRAATNKPKKNVKKSPGHVNNKLDKSSGFENMYPYPDPYLNPNYQLSNVNENELLYPPDYGSPQFPQNPTGLYSFQGPPNYPPQFHQRQSGPVSTRALHVTKHDVTHENSTLKNNNSTLNCTLPKAQVDPATVKNQDLLKEPEASVSENSSHAEAVAQSPVNFTGLETKQVANEILNEIIEELEDLKVDHNRNNPREGYKISMNHIYE